MTDHLAETFGAGASGAALDQLCINSIRTLTIDAVQKANSGHPGLPMGCADFAYILWTQFLKHNPSNPNWADRDRFVLSAGHGSMLLYSLLHLFSYPKMTLEQVKNFRQWGSITPGHPEYGMTPGVETTTGPLGQGVANGVGIAIAEAWLGSQFNQNGAKIVDHYTYGIVSDGDLQEGVAAEAVSLAGHLGLGKLIYFYDSNHITIEGETSLAYSDNVARRFEGYNWQVIEIDGHDHQQITQALKAAQADKDRPTLIIGKTIIGKGAVRQGTHSVHSDAWPEAEVLATKKNLGWPENIPFFVPKVVRDQFSKFAAQGAEKEKEWNSRLEAYRKSNPELAKKWDASQKKEIPADFLKNFEDVYKGAKPQATRNAGGEVLAKAFEQVPYLIGGSADLAPSTKTLVKQHGSFSKANRSGRNLHFGVREHAMGAIVNGFAYHGGVVGFTATFFVFSDYMRPPIRLAALSHLQSIFVFTHDSIFVGEDGPTHEPVEQLAALRAIPNLLVIRPSDATEVPYAWKVALQNHHGPSALILTRQNVPVIDRSQHPSAAGLEKGGYILKGSATETPDLILIATGSEVHLALDAEKQLAAAGRKVRVVALPSWELFEKQSAEYRNQVLPPAVKKRVAIEAGCSMGWARYVGCSGKFIGVDKFGASAPYQTLAKEYGLTVEAVVAAANQL